MCRAEYIIYACGHAKNHSTDCEVAEQHGALFNRVGCVNYTFASKYAEQHCGTGGFYCSQTQDGRLIDKAYDHFQALKPRLHAIKTELGTNHAALQGYISQAMAINMPLETLNMFALYQALQQQQMTIMRQNNELEQRHKYLQNLLAFAQNNRVQLQAAAASQPAWDGKEFDYTRSIFPEALLKPIQRKSPGRQAIPALSLGSGVEVALRPVQNVPQVQVAAPNTGFDARGYQHQQKRFRQDPTPPTAHRRQASTAPSNFSMEANIPKGNTPPNESTIEKVYRLRAHFAAEQNQKVANAMIRQGYDVENYGIKPPAKTGRKYGRIEQTVGQANASQTDVLIIQEHLPSAKTMAALQLPRAMTNQPRAPSVAARALATQSPTTSKTLKTQMGCLALGTCRQTSPMRPTMNHLQSQRTLRRLASRLKPSAGKRREYRPLSPPPVECTAL